MCQIIAPPPRRALTIDATTSTASSQWKARVGRSQTRTRCSVEPVVVHRRSSLRRIRCRCRASRRRLRTLAAAPEGRAPRSRQGDVHDPIVHAGADGSRWARHLRRLAAGGSPVRQARRRDPLSARRLHRDVDALRSRRGDGQRHAFPSTPRPWPTTPRSRPSCRSCPTPASSKEATRAKPVPSRRSGPRWTSSAPPPRRCRTRWPKLNVVAKTGNIDAIKAQVGGDGEGVQGLSRRLSERVTFAGVQGRSRASPMRS